MAGSTCHTQAQDSAVSLEAVKDFVGEADNFIWRRISLAANIGKLGQGQQGQQKYTQQHSGLAEELKSLLTY